MTRDPRPLVLIDARPARRRPVSGTATFVRELRRAIEEIAPTDIRLRWLSGPPGVPRRGRLTSAANAALDLGWTHVGLPVLALTLRARLIHGTFHWTPWFSPVPTSVVIHDLMWEHFPDETDPRFRRFATRFTRRSARRAKLVLVPSKATSADLTERYAIRSLPTTLLFRGGALADRITGFATAGRLREWLAQHAVALAPLAVPAVQERTPHD